MNARRGALAIAGLLLILGSIGKMLTTAEGLEIVHGSSASPPVTLVRPRDATTPQPLVLVAHGIAGSGVIMRGFGYTLAHAGYAVVLWDFDGHGANPNPFATDDSAGSDRLLASAEAALAQAVERGWGDPTRVAILGHSMGSGAALTYGQAHPETAATIAVSPTGQAVTPLFPRNLLLMAGHLEGRFVRNAEARLAEAAGPGGDPAAGTARELVIIPGVEHISILFSPTAHATARDWLDATFGPQPGAGTYTDRRILWYGLGLLGALLASVGFAPLLRRPMLAGERRPDRPPWWRGTAMLAGGLVATLALWLADRLGLEIGSLLGLVAGGYLLVWFALAGLVSLLLLWQRPPRLTRCGLSGGLLAFAILWLGVGWLGQFVWLPWLLIVRRLLFWPLGVVLLLPWFLAGGTAIGGTGRAGRLGWWLFQAAVVAGCAFLAVVMSPGLGFLVLILPLFPAILGFHAIVAGSQPRPWAFALSGALFTSWLLLAVFPLL